MQPSTFEQNRTGNAPDLDCQKTCYRYHIVVVRAARWREVYMNFDQPDNQAKERPGYTEYAQEMRYRLIPGVW